MALDEAMAMRSLETSLSTIRVYSFEPPCVTIGRFQDAEAFLCREACAASGVDVVRRPTGGGAILHRGDFTYCYTGPIGAFPLGNKDECFRFVAEGIVAALGLVGIEARTTHHDCSPGRDGWCFNRELGVDIEWRARKICGSAQRLSGGAVLQHGTLFLGEGHGDVAGLSASETKVSAQPPVSLMEASGRRIDFAELAQAFRRGFEKAHDMRIEDGRICEDEVSLARVLCVEKYGSACRNRTDYAGCVYDIIGPNNSAGDGNERQGR